MFKALIIHKWVSKHLLLVNTSCGGNWYLNHTSLENVIFSLFHHLCVLFLLFITLITSLMFGNLWTENLTPVHFHTTLLPISLILCCLSPRPLMNYFNPGSLLLLKISPPVQRKYVAPLGSRQKVMVEEVHVQPPPWSPFRELLVQFSDSVTF